MLNDMNEACHIVSQLIARPRSWKAEFSSIIRLVSSVQLNE